MDAIYGMLNAPNQIRNALSDISLVTPVVVWRAAVVLQVWRARRRSASRWSSSRRRPRARSSSSSPSASGASRRTTTTTATTTTSTPPSRRRCRRRRSATRGPTWRSWRNTRGTRGRRTRVGCSAHTTYGRWLSPSTSSQPARALLPTVREENWWFCHFHRLLIRPLGQLAMEIMKFSQIIIFLP